MKRIFLFMLLTTATYASVCAQNGIPDGYYDGVENLSGANLKAALTAIISNHTEYPYTSTNTDTWDILKESDADPNNSSNVIEVYSGRSVDGEQEYNDGTGWSREHVWPQSRGDFSTIMGIGTDLHNLKPVDISVNSARNNRWFDYADYEYIDDGYATGSKTSSTLYVWEPRDEVKGDIARIVFYIATRYEGAVDELDMELVDYFPPDDSNEPKMALLSTLKLWNTLDPVDDFEINRNSTIYSYQGNRNPFIDHPEYVSRIWGPVETETVFISEYIEGNGYNKAIELYNNSDNAVSLSGYRLEKDNGGDNLYVYILSLTGTIPAHGVYVIANSNASTTILSKANYSTTALVMSFNGDDQIRLVFNNNEVDRIGSPGNFGENKTFVRSGKIAAGSTEVIDPRESDEWLQLNTDCSNFLGYHYTNETLNVPRLFFSEYIEGSSYNKGLEIYNGTSQNIDLAEVAILKQTNGAGVYAGYALSGSIATHDVYTVVNPSANSTLLALADLRRNDGVLDFNGNDPVCLVYKGVVIDQIGVSGGSNFADDRGLTRSDRQVRPNPIYNTQEWTVLSLDNFSNFDQYTDYYASNPIILYAIAAGKWTNPTIWSNQLNGTTINLIPDKNSQVLINGKEVVVDAPVKSGTIILENGTTPTKLDVLSGILTVYGDVSISRNTETGNVELNVTPDGNFECVMGE
jgi:endonuclease I